MAGASKTGTVKVGPRHLAHEVAAIGRLLWVSLSGLLRGPREDPRGTRLQQMYFIGNRSVLFVIITLGCLGAILIFQAGLQAQRVIGDNALTGASAMPLLIRQLGPTLCGLMVATRVGTGIAAELGSMVVTEQVDALRMCGVSTVGYLVVPRLAGALVMLPALTVLGVAAAILAGLLTARAAFLVPPSTFLSFQLVGALDAVEGLCKATAYGLVIPVIAAHCGLAARGGSEGVGRATTTAVVYCSMTVIALDFAFGGLFLMVRA